MLADFFRENLMVEPMNLLEFVGSFCLLEADSNHDLVAPIANSHQCNIRGLAGDLSLTTPDVLL